MSRELNLEVQQVAQPVAAEPRPVKPAPRANVTEATMRALRIAWTYFQSEIQVKPSYDEADALDLEMYKAALRPMLERIRDGFLSADFVKSEEGRWNLQGGSDAVWGVTLYIRREQYRPTAEALYLKVCEVLGLEKPRTLSGAEAQAQRPVSAPAAYVERSTGIIPQPPQEADENAPWVQRFAAEIAREDETYNDAILAILGHLGSDAARNRVMDGILADRLATRLVQEDSQEGRAERKSGHQERKRHTRSLAARIAEQVAARNREQQEQNP